MGQSKLETDAVLKEKLRRKKCPTSVTQWVEPFGMYEIDIESS